MMHRYQCISRSRVSVAVMNVGIPVHWQRIRLGDSAWNKQLQEGKSSVPQGSRASRGMAPARWREYFYFTRQPIV
jgi:hypothetical protein